MLVSTGEQVSISLLAMAIQGMGEKVLSLTGPQAGIKTNNFYTKAKIVKIDSHRIKTELNKDTIVIVAGFQGINEKNDITTLGRGGSDTTAVALAAALNADSCEIYTDVDGVYGCDPRLYFIRRDVVAGCTGSQSITSESGRTWQNLWREDTRSLKFQPKPRYNCWGGKYVRKRKSSNRNSS